VLILLFSASLNSVHQILGRTVETGQTQKIFSKLEENTERREAVDSFCEAIAQVLQQG
jgi:hypothetical protein